MQILKIYKKQRTVLDYIYLTLGKLRHCFPNKNEQNMKSKHLT